ncbi:protein ARV1 [Prorops nasuta]|uniref:protein ARV1 n=1 Tax=Prorops nasuta TaxID=863751 RepID=UPI0034CD4CC4
MYICINCEAESEELYRRYCPNVLKILKCGKCGQLVDKYIEYDPVIVLVDLILVKKCAYRHILYNSGFKSYFKLTVILWLVESFTIWSACDSKFNNSASLMLQFNATSNEDFFEGKCNFYKVLLETAVRFAGFLCSIIITTEVKWMVLNRRPSTYSVRRMSQALVIGGCFKLLGLLGIVWGHVSPISHNILIQGCTIFSLMTAYSGILISYYSY